MSQKTEIDPVYTEQIGHGNSVAAWACVLTMMVGAIVGGIAFANFAWTLFWISMGVIILGLVLGGVLKAAGFGVGGSRSGAAH